MADKTITQLLLTDAVTPTDEFAMWDAVDVATRKATGAQLKAAMTDVDINGLTAVGTLDVADSVAVYDASATANRKATINEIKTLATNVDITGLTSATPATDDSVPIFDTSAGANRKIALSTILSMVNVSTDITGLGTVAGLDTADEMILYDVSAAANKKTTVGTLASFLGGGGGGSMDINGLPDAGSAFTSTDFLPFYDLSATGNRKMSGLDLVKNFPLSFLSSTTPSTLNYSLMFNPNIGSNERVSLLTAYKVMLQLGVPNFANPTPAVDDQIPIRDVSGAGTAQAAFVTPAALNAILDHGTMVGLGDDDHPQYAKLTGATFTGDVTAPRFLSAGGDLGAAPGPILRMERNTNVAAPAPASMIMRGAGGQWTTLWPDNSFVWRTSTSLPSGVSNADISSGTVVGAQSSSLDAKDVIGDPVGIEELLGFIAEGAASVRRFQYKALTWIDENGDQQVGERQNGGEEFSGVIVDYAGRYGTDRDDAHPNGKSLNTINGIGDLLMAVDYLVKQNADLVARVTALEAAHSMTLQTLLAAVGDGGQILVILLLVWLVWSKNRDQREAREFQRRMDDRTAALHEWTVRRMADVAMPEKEHKE